MPNCLRRPCRERLFAMTDRPSALAQLILTRHARYLAARFGERLSAHIREQFLEASMTFVGASDIIPDPHPDRRL